MQAATDVNQNNSSILPEKAKDNYGCIMWNGKFFHPTKAPEHIMAMMLIEGFMLATGFGLIAASITPLGVCCLAISLYGFYRTVRSIGKDEMREGLGKILGGMDKIDKLPLSSEGEGIQSICRQIDNKGETAVVIFNFYDSTKLKSWSFLVKPIEINRKEHERKESRVEVLIKGDIRPREGAFLEHLVKNKGKLLDPNSKSNAVLYCMTGKMDWSILES